MAKYLDETLWKEALSKPDWYLILAEDFARLEKLASELKDQADYKEIKREAYRLVEDAISNKSLPIASTGDDLDAQRKPIDTIVIHHTKNPAGMTLDRLNAMQLLRIYGRYYANPTDPAERKFKGGKIWSGHIYKEQQVFWGYHWLIREDGKAEHILKDDYIGWHSGEWDTNTRSVGICIDDDLSSKEPDETVINSLAMLIKYKYPSIKAERILGHCDVNKKTECPGYLFHDVWLEKLSSILIK